MAQAATPSHKRSKENEYEGKVPRVSMDYLYFGQSPVLCIKESKHKLVYAVPVKKRDQWLNRS